MKSKQIRNEFVFRCVLIFSVVFLSLAVTNFSEIFQYIFEVKPYQEGDIVKNDFYTPKKLVFKRQNSENLFFDEDFVELNIPPIYTFYNGSNPLNSLENAQPNSLEEYFLNTVNTFDGDISLQEISLTIFKELLSQGIFPASDQLARSLSQNFVLNKDGIHQTIKADELITKDNLGQIITDKLVLFPEISSDYRDIIVNFAKIFLDSNVYYDASLTKELRTSFRQQIEARNSIEYAANSRFLKKDRQISSNDSQMIASLSLFDLLQLDFVFPLILGLIAIIFLYGVFTKIFLPNYLVKTTSARKNMSIVGFALLLYVLGRELIPDPHLNKLFLTSFMLIIFYVYPKRINVILFSLIGILVVFFTVFNINEALYFFSLFLSIVLLSDKVHTRMQILLHAFIVSFITEMLYLILVPTQADGFLKEIYHIVIIFAVVSMVIFISLPILESLLRLATPFKLLELSNINSPVLINLLERAPGTYTHSLQVANLSEELAKAIGANSLLCRVASYYHDIGKIDNSQYFIENQQGHNPHNDIEPNLSAAIIKSHVKLGVEKANKIKLPHNLIKIIQQHHGDSVIRFFYAKAKEKNSNVNLIDYAYPGPKPQTIEAGIVLLADSVEAATRSLEKPTYATLEDFIEKLLNDIYRSDQLDECDMTFRDLALAKKIFSERLASFHHSRIKYPDQKEK